MKLLEKIQEILDVIQCPESLQKELSVNDVWYMWKLLRTRYRVIEYTQFYLNFAHDADFKIVLRLGLDELKGQAKKLEELHRKYRITMPTPSAESITINVKLDGLDDRQIFQSLFYGLQGFLDLYVEAFRSCDNAKIRQNFKEFLLTEIELYDKLLEYGKLKGWLQKPPSYRVD